MMFNHSTHPQGDNLIVNAPARKAIESARGDTEALTALLSENGVSEAAKVAEAVQASEYKSAGSGLGFYGL